MALPQETRYTYADLIAWETDLRYELYDGYPVALVSPSVTHQEIVADLTRQLTNFLIGKPCRAYPAPLDVRLFEQQGDTPNDVDIVVQPDLLVVCDREKVDSQGIHGAPDFIIEVLSPATERYDRFVKLNLYQKAGVKEYWIVNPDNQTVQGFVLEDGRFSASLYATAEETIPVSVLPGCEIDLRTVFQG